MSIATGYPNGWFKVEDVLPPENERVLVAVDDLARWVDIASLLHGVWYSDDELPIEWGIVAWHSLPEHPEPHTQRAPSPALFSFQGEPMSQQQETYALDNPPSDVLWSSVWQGVSQKIECGISEEMQHATDLATLADYGATAALELRIIAGVERVVLSDLRDPDAVRAFEGATAITEAAGWVRQNGGG